MPHLIAVSPALRRYWLEIAARHADAVALVLVKQSGGELSVQAAARSLTSVFSVIIDEIGQATKNDGDLRTVIESFVCRSTMWRFIIWTWDWLALIDDR